MEGLCLHDAVDVVEFWENHNSLTVFLWSEHSGVENSHSFDLRNLLESHEALSER